MPSLEEKRQQLEDAISRLEAQRGTLGDAAVDTSIAVLREKAEALRPAPTARQRKLVTVLFCDLADFTPMAESMDPEDVRDLLDLYFRPWREAVTRYRGRLEKFIGDAVMAVFGFPTASESDPENAIRAALEVREGLDTLNGLLEPRYGTRLAMRVGINTGLVLVSGGRSWQGDLAVTGDTVNLASRLEAKAPPNGILISHDTYRHVRGIFDVQLQEPIAVKGKSAPVQTYLVLAATPRAFHKGIRGVEGVQTRMIGREAELKRLQDALFQVMEQRERRVVTVIGEAGVGKSRLRYEFENWADDLQEQILLFKGRASRERQGLPYGLMRDLLAFRFQIQDSDRPDTVRKKWEEGFREALGEGQPSQTKAHFVGQLLGFDFGDSPHLREALDGVSQTWDARQIRDRALLYLGDYFAAMAVRLPTLILLEDLHWADGSSLDMLDRLAVSLTGRPVLIVYLARMSLLERRPAWGEGQAFHVRLRLHPLTGQDCRRLVAEILQRTDQVPPALSDLVVSKAEGNPFYVEELIKMLIEDGVISTDQEHWRVEPARLSSIPVPPTLAGVLQARLDRLPWQEQIVIQRAAVVGRRFWDQAVVHIGRSVDDAFHEAGTLHALSGLKHKEMVFRRPASIFVGVGEYTFKHALFHEVTYERVLKRQRRVYHGLVAEWLVERSGERVGEYYGLIADHLEAAGRSRQAIDYLRRAGDRAAIQFANAEAVAFFSRALDLTPGDDLTERHSLLLAREQIHDLLGDREAQARDLAELQRLANALHDKGRQAESALRQARYALATSNHPGAITAAQAAIQLAREAGDPRAEVAGHLHWGQALSEQSDFEAARRLLEKTVTLAQAGRLRPEQAQGLRHLGSVYWCLGEYPQAGIHYTESLALTRDIGDRRNEASALNNLGLVHWRQGEYAQASDYLERALQIRCQIGDRLGEASTLSNLTGLSLESGDLSQAQRYCEGALAITRQTGNRNREGLALLHLGDIQAALGAYADARACCEQALEILHGVGNQRLEGAALDNLANVCRCQGDYSPAIAYLEQALLITRAMGDRQSGAACLHDLGWVLHCLGDYRAARENYDEALQINREIGDRGREAEVLASLGLLSHHQGDHETARVYCQSASAIHQQVGRREMEGHALTNLGHALHSLGCMKEAAAAYRQALALRRDQGQPHLATEPLAGLARIALTQGNLAQARVHVQGILDHLQANTLEGTDEPFRVYLTCYRVLHGSQDPRAETILTTAHGLLLAQAAKIGDRGLQRSFLENVVTHRELLEAWQEHR